MTLSYPYQEPVRLLKTKDQVALPSNYGPQKVANDFDCKEPFDRICKLFGNPLLKTFEEQHIVSVDVVGFGPNKDQVRKLEVNRKLAPLFAAAFEKIKAANLPYVLYTTGGYFFRYMLNNDVRDALVNRPEYAELRKQPGFMGAWNIHCAQYDLAHKSFDEVIPYKGGQRAKKALLSNHSWGNAIDINSETNPYDHSKSFDMPRKIVEIFASFGFRWGGYYHDYMHFEYLRASVAGLSDEEPAQVFFPFNTEQKRESPLKYFFLNEGGKGGYFPLGQQQNLHGGVHLEPDTSGALVPVQVAMPGYIVAARLMAPGTGGDNPVLQQATEGRHLGFVLVRHDLTTIEDKKESEKIHPLYSLYMHLASPKWDVAGQEFEKAPWLASFLKMQFGAVVDLNPESADAGKTLWGKAKVEPDAASFQVQDRDNPLPARRGERLMALGKPSPKDVEEAIAAFKEGAIVTFDRPLFPVAAGETIGFVAQGTRVTDSPPRYLHWEMFSLGGAQDGVQVLLERSGRLKSLFKQVQEHRPNNFLEMPSDSAAGAANEVQSILGDTGVQIVKELLDDRYGSRLREYFNDGKAFFPAGTSPGSAEPFTYPFELEISNPYNYAGEPGSGGSCGLEVTYKKAGAPLTGARKGESLQIKPGQGKVALKVPAEADEIVLWSEHFFLDQPVVVKVEEMRAKRLKSREDLFEKAVTQHWRNLVLNHVNEWSPKGLVEQLDARKEAGYFDLPEDGGASYARLKEQLLPLCWWSRPKSAEDKFGEVPVLGADAAKSLFGAEGHLLPDEAKLMALHPITGLWLIDLLLEKESIAFKKAWPPVTLKRDESTLKPLYLGLLHKDPQPLLGAELLAVLVQHGYGSTDGANAADVSFWIASKAEDAAGRSPLRVCRASYNDGVALGRLRFPFWGQWEFYATDGQQQRFEAVKSGTTHLTLSKPAPAGGEFALGTAKPDPSGKRRTLVTGSFVIRENWPAALAGYLVLDHWRVPKTGQPETLVPGHLAIPVTAYRPPSEHVEGGLRFQGETIVGVVKANSNPKVTANFSFRDFVENKKREAVFMGAREAFRLAQPLAQRLQALCDLCRPKPGEKEVRLTLVRLTATGLSLLVAPASKKPADFEVLAGKLALLPPSDLFSSEREEADLALRLTYHPPQSSGPLGFEFDPGPVLGRLAAEVLSGEGEALHVRPRFIAPNGGHLALAAKNAVDGLSELIEASAEDIKAACGQDYLELVADRSLPPVRRFEFGESRVKMGRGKLIAELALHGDAKQWAVAGPFIKLKGGVDAKCSIVGSVVRAEWDLLSQKGQPLPERWGATLEFSAGITQAAQVATPPPPVGWKVEVKPRLDTLAVELKKSELRFVGTATCVPTDVDLRIVCERMIRSGSGPGFASFPEEGLEAGTEPPSSGGLWEEDPLITGSIRYAVAVRNHAGRCTDTGVFEASLPKSALKKDSGPFRFVWRPRVAKEGDPLQVHGLAVEAASTPVLTSSELELVR